MIGHADRFFPGAFFVTSRAAVLDGSTPRTRKKNGMLRAGIGSSCLLAMIATSSARADLLNLELLDFPDIFSGFIDVMYDAGSDQFTATGFALTFDDDGDGPQENITGGVFTIAGTILEGGFFTSGSLTIEGDVLGFGTTLLTADVVDFGFQNDGGDLFEFLFTITGGDLAIAEFYGGPGTIVGVILDANGSDFTGSFDQDFNNNDGMPGTGLGVSDTAPLIPGPGALLVLLAAGGLGARRRRRR